MKSTVLFSAIATLLCLIQDNESIRLSEITVRSDIYDKKPSFFRMPKTTFDHPRMKNFVQVHLEASFPYKMKLYCYPKDPRFCLFYDYFGNAAGAQISILKEDVRNVDPRVYDYEAIKDFVHTNFFKTPAYSVRVYFTQPDKLTEAGRQNTTEVADGLWTSINRKIVEIPRCQPNGPRTGTFKLQGCHSRKGTVYINNFGPFDSCKEAFLVYGLYEHHSLVGFGFFGVGYGSPGPVRDWYTHATGEPLKELLPMPPPCLEDLRQYNFTSIQVFLVDYPKKITCPQCSD